MTDICKVTRRHTLALGAGALVSTLARPAWAEEGPERHGISAFGDLKYPAGFKHFDYVDPNAPKGGTFSQIGATRAFNQNFLTFNSLNIFILKGDGAQGMELTFASLLTRAADEPDALYGLAARAVRISADGLTYRFLMRPGRGNGVNVSNGSSQSARKNTASVSAGANRKQHHKLSKPRARHDMQRQRSEALAQLTRGAERRSAVAN